MVALEVMPLDGFDQDARAHLAATGPLADYEKAELTSSAALFAIIDAGRRVASLLLRREVTTLGSVEAVVWAFGGVSGLGLVERLLPTVEDMARNVGASRIRFHTQRPGLVRVMRSLRGAEMELMWSVPNG